PDRRTRSDADRHRQGARHRGCGRRLAQPASHRPGRQIRRDVRRGGKPGILLDADGKPTTDPGAMYGERRGAVLTFGEHKGYALAFVCEMLAGALCGSGTLRPERQGAGTATNGMLTIVIDPSRLVDRAWLQDEIAAMTRYI